MNNKEQFYFVLLTLGILAQAAIFQVTSYVPLDNNIFFHSFAFIFILSLLSTQLSFRFDSWKPVLICHCRCFFVVEFGVLEIY